MIKLATIVVLIITFIGSAIAQNSVVYIAPFKYEGKDVRQLLPAFRIAVLDGINKSHRVDIIDRSESTVGLQPDEILEDAKKVNADLILQCELLNHNLADVLNLVQAIDNAVNNKSSSVYDQLAYNVKLIRVSDGILISSKKYENSGTAYSYLGNSSQALNWATNNALSWISRQICFFFEAYCPLEARIVEVAEQSKDRVTKVYINLGANASIRENLNFDVYVQKMVAGEATKDLLGRLVVMSVKSDNRSLCRISKNAKGIKQALDDGIELILISIAGSY